MKNTLKITIISFSLLISSCKNFKEINLLKEEREKSEGSTMFLEVTSGIKIKTIHSENSAISSIKLTILSLNYFISCIDDRAYLKIFNNDNELVSWNPIHLNFFYDTSFVDMQKDIHFLINLDSLNEGFILLPSFTEQYSTYFFYKYSPNSIEYLGTFSNEKNNYIGKLIYDKKSNQLYAVNKFKQNIYLKFSDKLVYETHEKNIVKNDLELILNNSQQKHKLNASWRIQCTNYLTSLEITENQSEMYLYSENDIYINIDVIPNSNTENEFYIKFKNTARFKNHYPEEKHVIDEEISKSENIAKLTLNGDILIMDWYGLYNIKTKTRDFVQDCIFVKENGGVNPIVLEKCDE